MNAQVKEWCREQCIIQHADTEADFAGMEKAWRYAEAIQNANEGMHLYLDDIIYLGYAIDPIANPDGQFRKGPAVFMDGGKAARADQIEWRLNDILDFHARYRLSAAEIYQALMYIHPFKDGNGRVGALVYNLLNGTINNPINPPDYK